jgi:hypothetical protein
VRLRAVAEWRINVVALLAKVAVMVPLFLSIKEVAKISGESTWTVKDLLRRGIYKARKSGRRTLVEFESVKNRAETLPIATFAPPTRRSVISQTPAEEAQPKRHYRRRILA